MAFDAASVRRALEEGQFVPVFQPLVVLRTGKLAGFEVLARWEHPEMGLIPPDKFVPIAERDGWIGALTRSILRKAFTAAVAIPDSLTLSVNISPLQLRDLSLPRQIQAVAGETGFSLDRVMIEITESALADNLELAQAIAVELKALGCRIALDDFGTGYSSLRHLQSLPFDELKVDRSFVQSMTERRDSRKIVAAVIGLGQSLGLTTVAEGVGTQEQADMLLWLGCDLGQGWLYGKPVAAEELRSAIPRLRGGVPPSSFRWGNLSIGNLEGLPSQKLAQLQAVYDGAPVGLGFLDRKLRYVNLNRRLADMHRRPVEEHLGRTLEEVLPEIFPQIEPALQRALHGEAVADVEVEGEGGTTYLCSYQPAWDEAGEVVGVSCAVLDFTARKRAEEKLRQFERVVEGLDEMIVVIDRNYRYLLANRSFLHYRGLEAHELEGRLVQEILGKEIFETVVKAKLDECFRGKSVRYELRYRYPVLGERDLLISYAPIEISGGIMGAACVLRDVTELKRMEQLENDWLKRIELAQRGGLRIGLWDWDINANTVIWSKETYRQWGYTPETFSGRVEDIVARIHPEDRARVEKAIGRVLSGEVGEYAEQYRAVWPDGSIRWLDAHGVILRNGSPHMLGVGLDITDLKRIQQSLQESEENCLLLLNSTAEAIYGLDLEGNCTFCNPASLRLLGYESAEELLGKNIHQLTHHTRPDGTPHPLDECVVYRAVKEGTPNRLTEEVMWRADGTSFPVEYWSHPMYKDGKLLGAVVTFLDITERKQAEEARRRSETRYRELFENATYGIFCSKEDGALLDVNPALVAMLGYGSKEELLALNLNTDIYEDAAARAAILETLTWDRHVKAAEANWRRKDGKTITVRLSGHAIRGEDGRRCEMEVIAEDVTERKSLEEQFRQAQKMQAVGQLAGGVAHDFNNLLTIINGYSELLLSRLGADDPERELVEQIKEAGWRSAALTRQLLVFSRKRIVAARPMDLNTVIQDVESMLIRIIGEDIELTSHLSAQPCNVRADAGPIEQVVMNLAVNARDAMPHGGKLAIRTERVELDETYAARYLTGRPGNYVLLTVSDTGSGMSEEVKSHLFEPFFTTKGPERGTGLGLAVVHGIVRDCGGHIEVESQVGYGTTFRIYLPEAGRPATPGPAPAAVQPASRGGGETILLVEDNDALRALTSHILRAQGYFVLEAVDEADGMRVATGYTEPIDLLVTDIVMPSVGGRQLAEQLRLRHPETKVLYLSGYTDEAAERHGVLHEEVDFLEKPFASEGLIAKIREVLDLRERVQRASEEG